jgi:hypothetical protein
VERADDPMLEQIEELLTAEAPPLARIEETLTEGYARALALEAERWRLERRIAQVAADGKKKPRKLCDGERKRAD